MLIRPEVLLVDVLGGSFVTIKECSMVLNHCCFDKAEIDKHCFEEFVQGLVEAYVKQVLVTESDILRNGDVMDASQVAVCDLNAVKERKHVGT